MGNNIGKTVLGAVTVATVSSALTTVVSADTISDTEVNNKSTLAEHSISENGIKDKEIKLPSDVKNDSSIPDSDLDKKDSDSSINNQNLSNISETISDNYNIHNEENDIKIKNPTNFIGGSRFRRATNPSDDLEITIGNISIMSGSEDSIDTGKPEGTIEPGKDYSMTDNVTKFSTFSYEVPFTLISKAGLGDTDNYSISSIEIVSTGADIIQPNGKVLEGSRFKAVGASKFTNNLSVGTTGSLGITFTRNENEVPYGSTVSPTALIKVTCSDGIVYKQITLPTMHLTPNKTLYVDDNAKNFTLDSKVSQYNGEWGIYGSYTTTLSQGIKYSGGLMASEEPTTPITFNSTVNATVNSKPSTFKIVSVKDSASSTDILNSYSYDDRNRLLSLNLSKTSSYTVKFFIPIDEKIIQEGGKVTLFTSMSSNALNLNEHDIQTGIFQQSTSGSKFKEVSILPTGKVTIKENLKPNMIAGSESVTASLESNGSFEIKAGSYQLLGINSNDYTFRDGYDVKVYHVENLQDVMNGGQTLTDILTGKIKPLQMNSKESANLEIRQINKDTSNVSNTYYLSSNLKSPTLYKQPSKLQLCSLLYLPDLSISEAKNLYGSYLSSLDSIINIDGKTYICLGSHNPNVTQENTIIRFNTESTTDAIIQKFGVKETITSFLTSNNRKSQSNYLTKVYDYDNVYNIGFNLTYAGNVQEYLFKQGAKIVINVPTDFKVVDNKPFDADEIPVRVYQDRNQLIFEFTDNYKSVATSEYGDYFKLVAPIKLYDVTAMKGLAPNIVSITGVNFDSPALGNPDINDSSFCTLSKESKITQLMPVKVSVPIYNVDTKISDTIISPEYTIKVNNDGRSAENIVVFVGAPNSEYSLSMAKNNPNHLDSNNGNGRINYINPEGSIVYFITSDDINTEDKNIIQSKNLNGLMDYYTNVVTRRWAKYTGQDLPNNIVALAIYKEDVEPGSSLHSSFKTNLGVWQSYTDKVTVNSMFNYMSSAGTSGSESNIVKTAINQKPSILHVKYLNIFGDVITTRDITELSGHPIDNPNIQPRQGYSFATMTFDNQPITEFPTLMPTGEHTLILTETKVKGKSKEVINFIDTNRTVLRHKYLKGGLEGDTVDLQSPPEINGYYLVRIINNKTNSEVESLPDTLGEFPSEYTCIYAKNEAEVTTTVVTEAGKELYRGEDSQVIGERLHPKTDYLDNIDWEFYDKNNIQTYVNGVLVDTITQLVNEGTNEIKLVVKPQIGVINIKVVTDTGEILSKAITVKGEIGAKVDSRINYDNSIYNLVNIKVNGNIVNEEPHVITAGTTDVVYTVSKKPATINIQLVNETTGDITNIRTLNGKLQDNIDISEPLFDTNKYDLVRVTQDGETINSLPTNYSKENSTVAWHIREKSKSTITVNVMDEYGYIISSDSTTNYRDAIYNHLAPIIDSSIYNIYSSPNNIPRQFTNNDVLLTYHVSRKTTNINIKVLNADGEEVVNSNSYIGKIGDSVDITKPNIPHEYSLVNITNNGKIVTSAPVSFSKDNQEIIYHVKKKNKSSVTISVIEKGTNDVLLKPVMYEGYVGEQIKIDKINIPDDYEVVDTIVNSKSTNSLPTVYNNSDTVLVYIVQRKQVSLNVKIICNSEEISSNTYTGKPNGLTNAQLPNIPRDYNLVKVTVKGANSTNIPVNFGAHDIELTYHVQKRSKGNIYTKVVTTDGKQIGNTITSTGYVGDRFILKEPNWDNNKYYIVSVSNIPSTYVDEDATILYTIAPRPSVITIRVRTVNGDVIYSKSYTGVVGDNFKYDKPVIPESYNLIKTPTMSTQFNKTNETFDYIAKAKDTGTYKVILKTDDNVVLYESSSTKVIGTVYSYPKTGIDMNKYDIVSKPNLIPSTYVKGNHDLVTIVKPHISTITIKVVDGDKELSSKSYIGQTGDDFKFEEPNIDPSYEFVLKPDYIPEKFSRDDETLLYSLVKKREPRKSTITIISKDSQDNVINFKTYTGIAGSNFRFVRPMATNGKVFYTNDTIPTKFGSTDKTIIYYQSKIGRSVVNINAVDRIGEDLMDTKTYNGNIGSKIPYGKLVFDENKYRIDYVTVNGSKVNNVPMYFTNETQNVTYHLREMTSNISSKIVLDDNTLIKDLGTQTGVYGSQYHTLKPEIPTGYTLISRYVNGVQNAELPNKYGKGNIEIVYVVKRDSNSNVLPKQDIVKQLTDRNINTQLSELDDKPSTALVLANTGTLETQSSGIISSILTAISALLVHLKLRRKNDNN